MKGGSGAKKRKINELKEGQVTERPAKKAKQGTSLEPDLTQKQFLTMVVLSESEVPKPITVIYPIAGLNTFPLPDLTNASVTI